MQQRKSLVIALPREDVVTLEELADLQERTPQQQALFLLRGVLQEKAKEPAATKA